MSKVKKWDKIQVTKRITKIEGDTVKIIAEKGTSGHAFEVDVDGIVYIKRDVPVTFRLHENEVEVIGALRCKVCDKPFVPNYMVHNPLWEKAGLKGDEYCDPWCLETLLGRKLTVEDFTKAPVNDLVRWAMTGNFKMKEIE